MGLILDTSAIVAWERALDAGKSILPDAWVAGFWWDRKTKSISAGSRISR
jgi:hypothetical protein